MIIVQVNQQDFFVEVILKRSNRKIYLRIHDGVIKITTPTKLTKSMIENMIQKNFTYIIHHMKQSPKIEDRIHYLGKIYPLNILLSSTNSVYVKEEEIRVEVKDFSLVGKLLEELYINTLKNVVETYSSQILSSFQIEFPVKFQYKKVKGYYGECFPKQRKIILATKLAKYDLKYILSVIYHECAHFKYQNHQASFYQYLEQRYPNYRAVQRELRKIVYNEKY